MTASVHSSACNPHPDSRVRRAKTWPGDELGEAVWRLHRLLVRPTSAGVDVRSAKRRLLQVLQATAKQPLPQMFVAPLGSPHGRKGSREEPLIPTPRTQSRHALLTQFSRTHGVVSKYNRCGIPTATSGPLPSQTVAADSESSAGEPESSACHVLRNDEHHEHSSKGASGVASSHQCHRDTAIRRQSAGGAPARRDNRGRQRAKTRGQVCQTRAKAGESHGQ